MTVSQKTLAAHTGLKEVKAGQSIEVSLDLVLRSDVASPVAINEMKKMDRKAVFNKGKTTLVMDHFTPNKSMKSAEDYGCCRGLACRHEIANYLNAGDTGTEHALLPEKRLMVAGDAVIGAGSHTCTCGVLEAFSTGAEGTDVVVGMVTGKVWSKVPSAIKFQSVGKPTKWISGRDIILRIIGMASMDGVLYKSMESTGEGIRNLSTDDRSTVCSMTIGVGGKNGISPVGGSIVECTKERSKREFTVYEAGEDTEYDRTYVIDLSKLKPMVSFPHLPSSTGTIDRAGEVRVNQTVIGSCISSRIGDMRVAAEVLKGREITKGVHYIVIPTIRSIYPQTMKEGLLEIFIEVGAVVSTPTCGPCLSGYMGILTARERCISTTGCSFVERTGHVDSEVCLVGPAVTTTSAVTGKVICPCQLD